MEGDNAAAHVLTLLDFYWFYHRILGNNHRHPPPPPESPPLLPPSPDLEDAESHTSEPLPATIRFASLLPRHRHSRSLSDELAPSPESLHVRLPKLQTILSGKEGAVGDQTGQMADADSGMRKAGRWSRRRRQRRTGGSSRSLSELEFEELKGFMDLGFTFSEADADPKLMSIVPGLQRLRAAAAGDGGSPAGSSPSASDGAADEQGVSRPYLSEAWDAAEEAAEQSLLRNWRVPASEEGVDIKDHLRFWAHTVASTVR